MFFTGISDEAGLPIERQIQAHKKLGWQLLELREVAFGLGRKGNITSVPGATFKKVARKIAEAGLTLSCFSSAIANWARPITGDFSVDVNDLKRGIRRMKQMHRLNTNFIRVMSYPNDKDHPLSESDWRREAIRRMKILAQMAKDGGVTLVHENCSGWGGQSAENSNILLGEVNSPALKVVFDTGNPVTYGQDAWEYYLAVRKDIVYVHIKDARIVEGQVVYTYCGEGDGYVRRIVGDLLAKGYEGGFSIEPHLEAVIHADQQAKDPQALYDSYVEYGKRFMRIVEEVKPKA